MRRIRVSLLALMVCFVVSSSLQAASPVLNGVTPRGVQRGTEVVLTFNGARLADSQEILFYSPGFTVTKLEPTPNAVKATVQVAPTCALGEHAVRVRTASGISELRTVWVGAYPSVAEVEPNNEFTAPQKIGLNVTIEGVVQTEDVDYYAVQLKKGQRLSVEIEAMRLANTLFDPYIAILDAKRFELATSDDAPLLGQDALCSIVAPADGTYFILVRDSSYQGNGACGYRLHVGHHPRPTAVVPAGGRAGEEIEVTFLGDPTGPIKQKVKVEGKLGETVALHCQDAQGISPSGIPFRISDLPNVIEKEPNADHSTATRTEVFPAAFNGVIEKAGQVDHYRFKASKGQVFEVHCFARRLGSPLDPVMTLFVAGGGAIASNDDSVGPDSYFRVTIPNDGEYVISVTDHLGKGGPTYFYRVEFIPVPLVANLSIPKVNIFSQERQTLSVPKGGRMASLVTIGRANFGGELVLGANGLPAGISLQAENLAANLDTLPVLFEAAPTAAISGRLVELTAKHADPKHPPITSRFAQTVELVTGNPGQSIYWKKEVDRLAVAVTQEAPYAIDVIEPKVPLIQNGSLQVKVVARRQATFKGPITVYPLWNPPGVSSASAVTIPAEGTEVLLPYNAAGNAQIKKWKTAVIAVADAGQGPVWTSSQLFHLEVVAPFVVANMQRGAVEQGQATEMVVKLQHLSPFEGTATIKLLGLPPRVTAPEQTITKDTPEVIFKLTTEKTTPAGNHRNLFCQVIVPRAGEVMVANTGYSELRVDVPIVKVTPPPMPPMNPKAQPTPPAPPTPPKRLSRLEQLRKEQEEREKAQKDKKN
ncbi:MAG: PPC domain-containing protein [Gemmataceae bacterium]